MGSISLLILNKTQSFASKLSKPGVRQREEEPEEKECLILSTIGIKNMGGLVWWLFLYEIHVCICRTCGELLRNTFTSLRVSICSTSGMNKQTLFNLNSSSNSELWLGFDGGYLAKNPVRP